MKLTKFNATAGLFVIALIYIIYLQQCRPAKIIEVPVEVKATPDTTLVSVQSDTVFVPTYDTIYKEITVKVPYPVYTEPLENFDECSCEMFNTYSGTVDDDTVSIKYTAKTWGELSKLDLSYTIDKERFVTESKTYIIEKEVEVEVPVTGLYAGIDMGVSPDGFQQVNLMAELCTKKGFNYELGYGILDQSILVGLRTRISFKFLTRQYWSDRKVRKSNAK